MFHPIKWASGTFVPIIHEDDTFVQTGGQIMRELHIQLRSVQDVRDFVAEATSRPFPVYVKNGGHQVNGTSFMEMCCLNQAEPLIVLVQCGDEEYQKLCLDLNRFAVI